MTRPQLPRAAGLVAVAATAVIAGSSGASAEAPVPSGEVTLTPLGTFAGGGFEHAEIVAFDPSSDRMVISNNDDVRVDIVSIANPAAPSLVTSFDLTPYGDGVNGVAVSDGLVAAAVEVDPVFDPQTGAPTPQNGSVVFFRSDGTFVADIEVGVLPDAVAFSPDGTKLVVSGEGEPVCAQDVGGGEDGDPNLAVDPNGTVGLITVNAGVPVSPATILDFTAFDTSILQAQGVRIFFPGSTAAQDLEPEYAVVSGDSSTAYITLQEANALAVVDLDSPAITAVVPLGTKDFSSILMDPSNWDSGIELANWDVQGIYMPDAIDEFTVGGTSYLVTANEGDSRDYDCYSEEERMAGLDFTGSTLDADLIAAAQDDARLGRLNSTTAMPTADPIDALYTWGGRSFTIWNTAGQVVWDSGSQFAEYIAANYPDYFNTQADDSLAVGAAMVGSMADEVDERSDDKGTEPEAVVVGQVGERFYAFVGLERQGGIMVYDVTTPAAPQFEDYVNVALDELDAGGDFTGPGTSDVSPEGVFFVSATDSPTGRPLLLVSNELSGTTTVYEVTGSEIDEQLAPPATTTTTTTTTPTTTVPSTAAPTTTAPATTSPFDPGATLPSTGLSTGSSAALAVVAGLLVAAGWGLTALRRRA